MQYCCLGKEVIYLKGLRIVIADPDASFCKYIRDKLTQAGYIVVDEAYDGRSALQMVYKHQPDVVLVNTFLEGIDGMEICNIMEGQKIAPVVLIADYDDYGILAGALRQWVFGYLVKPVDIANLIPNLEIAVANFKRVVNLEEENKKLKQNLEVRKLVERAKGILVESMGFTEQEAFKYIQKTSMDNCIPIKKVAMRIISKHNQKLREKS